MANDSKDIELRVRARDYSTKTLDGVSKALDGLTKAQDDQLKAAKRGEVSARELEASYKQIESAVTALLKQNNLVNLFNDQAAALAKTKAAADEARAAQTAYAKSVQGIEKLTKDQAKAQRDLAAQVKAADREQLRAQNRYDLTAQSLKNVGIEADKVQAAQQRMAQGVAVGNAALERQQAALDSVEVDIRQAAQAREEAAAKEARAAQEQARAQKATAEAAAVAAQRRQQLLVIQNQVEKANYDGVKAEQAATQALRQAADQAVATAKGYVTLARSIKSVRGNELSEQLRAIADPAGAANSTLDGVGEAIGRLATQVNAIRGPVKDFRTTLASLNAAMQGVSGIAAQIDAYKRQKEAVLDANIAYVKAGNAVKDLVTAMRSGRTDVAGLTQQMTAAQAAFKATAVAASEQNSKFQQMGAALKAAGVDVNKLSEAEAKLLDQARKATGAVDQLTAAYKKHGAAAESSGKSVFSFFTSTRTTLSYTQRLRGELLGLATAFIGVQGAISLAEKSLDAYNTINKIQSQLTIASGGDAALARKEYEYLSAAADRIGISLREAAPAYAKFAIAAKAFGLSGQDTRFIFEGVALAARKAGLSASDFEGVLKAVEQGFSKGSIQAEELRGQLGDRLPGAFVLFAKSIGKTTEELGKLMEQNGVAANAFINFARTLNEDYKGASDQVQALSIAQAQFANATLRFQDEISRGGFADAYTELLNKLTAFMNSPEGKEFAVGLGQAFKALVDVIKVLIDNIETVKLVLSVLLGIGVAKWAFAAVAGFTALISSIGATVAIVRGLITAGAGAGAVLGTLGGAATATAGGIGILRGAILLLTRTIPLLAALSAGIMVAKYAYDKLKASKDRAASDTKLTGNGAEGSWDAPKNGSGTMPTPDPGTGFNAEQQALKRYQGEIEKQQKKGDKDLAAARKKGAKDDLSERQDLIKEKFNLQREGINAEIKNEADKSKLIQQIDAQEKQALLADKIRYDAENARSGAAAASKEVTVKEQVKNELLRIQDELIKQEVKLDQNATFDEKKKARLDAIAHTYDKLKKSIATLSTLDKAAANDASTKLDGYIKQLQAVESQKVTLDEIKSLEKELDDQIKLRAARLDQEQKKYDSSLTTQEEFLRNTAAINADADNAVNRAADNLQKFVDKAVEAKSALLSATDQAEITTKVVTARATVANPQRQANDAQNKADEDALNNLVAKRTAAEALLRSQLDLRAISEDEYAAKSNANADTYKAKILELTDAILVRTEAQRAEGILNGTLNVTQIAALDAQIARVKQLRGETANALPALDVMQKNIANFASSGIDAGFNALVQSLTDIASGAKGAGDAFKNLGTTVASFVANFLLEIGKAIAKQLILNALTNSGNPYLAAAGAAAGGVRSPKLHSGGRVGRNMNGIKREVPMSLFANAPRLHEGGLPGLKAGEVPAILQEGEQVLSRDDPNNILNGQRPVNMENMPANRFVLVDDRSGVISAMQSAEGEKATLVNLKRNAATIKQIARG